MFWSSYIFSGATLLVSAYGQAQSNTASVNTGDNGPVNTQEVPLPSATVAPLGGKAGKLYSTLAWLPPNEILTPELTQHQTNGDSVLGTTGAPLLPEFISGSPLPNGSYPWGDRTAKTTNYYQDIPNTGVTRHYNFTLSYMSIAPDGVQVDGIVINQQFPGPTITANWGDWIEVTVTNKLDEGTSLHWHGLLQKDTPWYDGIPGVSQCPIAPGSTFTYRFRADLYGHSHFSAQYAGGALGPLIIYGPHDNAQYDVDLGPVLLNDWYHTNWENLVDQVMAPFSEGLLPPQSNNVLINGKMNYPCDNSTTSPQCTPNAGISKFRFTTGKTYRLRLINAGAEAIQKFSIDGYNLTIIANDFVPIVPYTTNVVTLAVGQRADVIVKATGKPTDAVWMRSELGPSAFVGGCSVHDGVSPVGYAAIYYQKANTSAVPTSNSTVPAAALTSCRNDPLQKTVPYYSLTPTKKPQTSQNLHFTFQRNETNELFYVNNSTFRVNFNDPVLLDTKNGNLTFPTGYNVYNFGQSKSIRLVLYDHALVGSHPMHMHGHNMYILQEGTGVWDGSIVNPANPRRVDTYLLPAASSPSVPSYAVVQIDADNPGVWPFHCHIAWHVSAGLYINILERPDDIQKDMQIPDVMAQTCRDWTTWTSNNIVDVIDSGL